MTDFYLSQRNKANLSTRTNFSPLRTALVPFYSSPVIFYSVLIYGYYAPRQCLMHQLLDLHLTAPTAVVENYTEDVRQYLEVSCQAFSHLIASIITFVNGVEIHYSP